MEGQM